MGFTFDGTHSREVGITARLLVWQAGPPLSNVLVAVPGRAGVVDFGARATERIITLDCGIRPQAGIAELVGVCDRLAGWLDPGGLGQLVLDDAPDRFWNARLSGPVDVERLIRSAGRFPLEFLAPDPYAYALSDETFTLSGLGNHVVTRTLGNAGSLPIYQIKAAIQAGGSVTVATNGEGFAVVGPLNAGETLVVDAARVTARVVNSAGETLRNGLPLLRELNFPALRAGANQLHIAASGAVFTELKIIAGSRWM